MQCPVLKSDFAGASPPVEFVQGMSCDSVFKALEQTTYRGSKFADMLTHWTCAADLVVDEVNEVVAEDRMATEAGTADYILPFNLQFNKTAAQCMPGTLWTASPLHNAVRMYCDVVNGFLCYSALDGV